MIQIIAGREGAGKTKNLIDMANDLTKVTDGHIVYVDADNSHIYHLSHQILSLIHISWRTSCVHHFACFFTSP